MRVQPGWAQGSRDLSVSSGTSTGSTQSYGLAFIVRSRAPNSVPHTSAAMLCRLGHFLNVVKEKSNTLKEKLCTEETVKDVMSEPIIHG